MFKGGKNKVPWDRHWCGTNSPFYPPLSPRPLPTHPSFLMLIISEALTRGAFWVSDNRIIILLKSVLIVSKLLVTVSRPGDLGGRGRRHFKQTHLALKLVFVKEEEWQIEITCVPQYTKWLLLGKKWAPLSYLIATIKEPLGCMSGGTTIPKLSFHLIEMHSVVLPQAHNPTEAIPYFYYCIFLTESSGRRQYGPNCQGLHCGEFPGSDLDSEGKK